MSRHRALALAIALLCALTGPTGVAASGAASAAPGPSASRAAAFAPMQLGDTGWRVRVLQSRLHQLDLHSEVVTSTFDRETRDGVATFQRRRGWTADGVVDERTWLKIVSLTTTPTTESAIWSRLEPRNRLTRLAPITAIRPTNRKVPMPVRSRLVV